MDTALKRDTHARSTFYSCRTNNGHRSGSRIQEDRWLRHDEVGLEQIGCGNTVHRSFAGVGVNPAIEVGECEIAVGDVRRVSRFVMPDLEMHGFARADGKKNPQNFQISYFLSQRRVKASATLLD